MQKLVQHTPFKASVNCEELFYTPRATLAPFDPRCIDFLNDLSVMMLGDKSFNRHPEIVSLAFWLRKGHLTGIRKENLCWIENQHYAVLPIGTVFHIAPSNVDTLFLYSACISLLMGNRNIIRLSSSNPPSVSFILDCLNRTLGKETNALFKDYLHLVSYGHDDQINTYLTQHADGRVIWGGDHTVAHFKAITGPVSQKDIYFPNRVSHALVKARSFMNASEAEQKQMTHHFFNDAYVFDQLGCSSPRIIYLLGTSSEKEAFIPLFSHHLNDITKTRYTSQASSLSAIKFNHLIDDVLGKEITSVRKESNAIYLLENPDPSGTLENCVGGYFYLTPLEELSQLPRLLPRSTQTLSYYGFSSTELDELSVLTASRRIDRIVPMGQALSFHYIWDGMNLFEQLSRKRFLSLS